MASSFSPLQNIARNVSDPHPLQRRDQRVACVPNVTGEVEEAVHSFVKLIEKSQSPLATNDIPFSIASYDFEGLLFLHTLGADVKLNVRFGGEH